MTRSSRRSDAGRAAPPGRIAPFDVVEASRRVWLERWEQPEAASGMAVFTAILRSNQMLTEEVNAVMKRHGFTFAQYQVLAWLEMDPESALTLSWISKTLRIPPASVTDIIDHLEEDKLVRRAAHPTDARTTLAVITARGRRAANAATEELNTAVYVRLGLSETQRNQLLGLLAALRVSGEEFDVVHSDEVIADVGARAARKRRAGPIEVV